MYYSCNVFYISFGDRGENENELQPLEFELDDGPAIEMLLDSYPNPVAISDLPHSSEDDEDKISITRALFKEGFLIIVDNISKQVDDTSSTEDGEEESNSTSSKLQLL